MTLLQDEFPPGKEATLTGTIHELQNLILASAPESPINERTLSTMECMISRTFLPDLPVQDLSELDSLGTGLWNTCEQVWHSGPMSKQKPNIMARVKTLAFKMVERGTSKTPLGHTRILKLAFATARWLIENDQLNFALIIFEIAAQRLDLLQFSSPAIEPMNIQSLTSEYYMLRAKLVCLQGRSDIAEYLYAQVPPPGSINNLNQAVVSQLCHEIGCNASEAYEHELAIKWLKRAAEWIDRSQSYENTVAVLVLCLEGFRVSKNPREDVSQFIQTLGKLFSTQFSPHILELAHFYIKFSESLGTTVVLQAFDLFLLHLPINQRDWIDQSFVFFTTTVIHLDISEEMRIATVDKAAHALNKRGFDGLSEPGTHAVFAVVWKHIDGLGDEYYSTTQQWCKLLLNNEILQTSSEFNKIQIQKKFVECALETKQENDPYFASSMRYDEEGDTIVYSPTELAYLATTSFNRAMDFYSEEKDIECKHWVEESIRLAKLMGNAEGDGLVLLFKNKLEGLF